KVQERLFATKPILLGVEESLRHPNVPCGLRTDAERARHVRKRVREMLNSRGQWESVPAWVPRPIGEILTPEKALVNSQNTQDPASKADHVETVSDDPEA